MQIVTQRITHAREHNTAGLLKQERKPLNGSRSIPVRRLHHGAERSKGRFHVCSHRPRARELRPCRKNGSMRFSLHNVYVTPNFRTTQRVRLVVDAMVLEGNRRFLYNKQVAPNQVCSFSIKDRAETPAPTRPAAKPEQKKRKRDL
jgi:hypothetical protein